MKPIFFLALIIGLLIPPAEAAPKNSPLTPAQKLQQELALDRAAGLLNAPWTINKVSIRGLSTLPPQLQPGLPPYPQQPERAQTIATPGMSIPPPLKP